MTSKKDDLKNQLQNVASNQPQVQDPAKTIDGMLKRLAPQIARALPKHMTADRLARIALTTIRQNPKLLECTQESLMGAVMLSAQLGLEPGPLGHAYLVPYNNKKKDGNNEYWVKEAQFQIGYKGMIDLVRRSGEIQTIYANEVYEKDYFKAEYGSNGGLIHRPYYDGDRGEAIRYYAFAKLKDGGEYFFVMSKFDAINFRDKYCKSKDRNGVFYGPWVDEFDNMAKKTVLKQMMKYMPLSIEVQKQIAADETIKIDITEDMTEVPNVQIDYDYNPTTGETVPTDIEQAQQETAATSEDMQDSLV